MFRLTTLLIWLFLIIVSSCGAQQADTDSIQTVDTLLFEKTGLFDQASRVTNPTNFETKLTQNPTIGLFKSVLVPGWGQYGNRKYVKAAFFLALDAWMVGEVIHYGRQASDFKDQYENAVLIEDRNEFYDLYLDRKDERNKFTWFAVITTFISMFDAYVDAHLSGYPKGADESAFNIDVGPVNNNGFGAVVSVSF